MSRTGLYATAAVGLAGLAAASILLAHPDDPKQWERISIYHGKGWRAGQGGNPPDSFQGDGVNLLSWITPQEFGQSEAMDCWGYVAPSGREYAIICLGSGTGFVEITDPQNPVIVGTVPGPNSGWRDVKVFDHYAYVIVEGDAPSGGVQVIDMGNIDNGVVTEVNTVHTGGEATHNVAINTDSGYLYRTGGAGNGLLIYNLNASPTNPPLVGSWPDRYVHDAQIVSFTDGPYAGREIAYCLSGFNGGWDSPGLDILDVTNKANIIVLSRYEYPEAQYSHQGWLSPDRQYLYQNDELDEYFLGVDTRMHVLDVSDINNPTQVNTVSNGLEASDHNLYVAGDLIYCANYKSGLRVFDRSQDPEAPVEIAWYDTYPPNNNSGFSGLWSCYPFFPSGVVIGSDRTNGLFVWEIEVLQTTQTVEPDNFVVDFGIHTGGGLADLLESDDSRLSIRNRAAPTPIMPVGRIEIVGVAPTNTTPELTLRLEARATALPANVPQRIHLFNFSTNQWEQVDNRTATRTDSVVDVLIDTNPDRFIEQNSNVMSARAAWFSPGAVVAPNWNADIDQMVWILPR